jgi:hypothetical protein
VLIVLTNLNQSLKNAGLGNQLLSNANAMMSNTKLARTIGMYFCFRRYVRDHGRVRLQHDALSIILWR